MRRFFTLWKKWPEYHSLINKSDVKESFRYFKKNKMYLLTSVLNLSTLLFAVIMGYSYLSNELSFDTHYEKRIFRVVSLEKNHDLWDARSPVRFSGLKTVPFEKSVRLIKKDAIVKGADEVSVEENILVVDPEFLDLFAGGSLPVSVLQAPYSLVLTQSMATKYFKNANPVGERIKLFLYDPNGDGADYLVTGVIPDQSKKSHIKYDFLVSYNTYQDFLGPTEGNDLDENYTYVSIGEGLKVHELRNKINETLIESKMGDELSMVDLQPIESIHLKSDLKEELGANGSLFQVVGIVAICLLISLVCMFNYLGVFQNEMLIQRKQLEIKSSLGLSEWGLIRYLSTQLLISLSFSIGLGYLIIELFGARLEGLVGSAIRTDSLAVLILLVLIVAALLTNLFLILIKKRLKKSVESLKSDLFKLNRTITAQMTVTLFLLGLNFVIAGQLDFLSSRDIGFQTDNLVLIKTNGNSEVMSDYNLFRRELEMIPEINKVSRSNSSLLGTPDQENFRVSGSSKIQSLGLIRMDKGFFDLYGIQLLHQSETFNASDTSQIFLSSNAFNELFGAADPQSVPRVVFDEQEYRVTAIFDDIYTSRLLPYSQPLSLIPIADRFSNILVKYNNELDLAALEENWSKFFPFAPFDFSVIQDSAKSDYQDQIRNHALIRFLAIVNVFVMLLGVFSFIRLMVTKGQREIAIRKVHGASSFEAMKRFSMKVMVVNLIANAIATPFFLYFGNLWLTSFALRSFDPIRVVVYISVLSFAVVIFSILSQYMRVYLTNPLVVIKEE